MSDLANIPTEELMRMREVDLSKIPTEELMRMRTPASVSFGQSLREIPRQVGLAGRYLAEGLGSIVDIGAGPLSVITNAAVDAAGLDKGGMRSNAPAQDTIRSLLDRAGVPSPNTPDERVIGDASRLVAGSMGMGGAANTLSKLLTGTGQKVAQTLAANQGQQGVVAASSGLAGGSVREAGGGPLEQFGASLVGGLAGAGMSALGAKLYTGISDAIKGFMSPKMTIADVNIVLNDMLQQNGVDVSRISGQVRADLAKEVKAALDTGKQLNPEVIRRIADYSVVGATPTRGTVTLDPAIITQEKNLAKVGMNSQDPALQTLGNLQNANNRVFIENLNELSPRNPAQGGNPAIRAVQARDAAARQVEKGLYAQARDSAGRPIELDREGFIFAANNNLGKSGKGAFLPDNIKKLLEQVRTGTAETLDGHQAPVPFNVDVIDNLKTTLSSASRSAGDGNVRAAIKDVRDALEATQPKAVGRPVGGNQVVDPAALSAAQSQADTMSQDAMAAFDRARRYARGLRNWRESSPGIAAALDDPNPERFVKDFIIAGSDKAQTANVESLMHTLRKDPGAEQAVKQSIVGYLKEAALGKGVADEVGNFSQSGYNKALDALGDMKLKIFFSKDEIAQLKALGRVASYEMVQPKGSAVNNSNTAAGLAGILDRIASSQLVGKIPMGDAMVRTPARNWSTSIGVRSAMAPFSEVATEAAKPKGLTIQQLMGTGLLLAAPRSNAGNDDRRR